MPEPWYEGAAADAELTQGDFIMNCPLLAWKAERPVFQGQGEVERLTETREIVRQDVVIMTQACDLEQRKVKEVVVCLMYPLTDFKTYWEDQQRSMQQNPTIGAWKKFCDNVTNGFVWNYAMLNEGQVNDLRTEHRIVDFHDIYTLPIEFLEGVAAQRGPRIRLRPPYREHLSQAFARYFMRVGLPSSVEVVW